MKRTIVAILALVPAALFAQTVTPAQPSSTPVLQSRVSQPASLVAVENSFDRPSVAPTPVKISTGVVAPKLLHAVEIDHVRATLTKLPGQDSLVVVAMTVDATGKPTNLKVVKGQNAFMDQGVLDTVSQYRYQPGTLDGRAVAVPVTINYTIK
jgi:TonB family protein